MTRKRKGKRKKRSLEGGGGNGKLLGNSAVLAHPYEFVSFHDIVCLQTGTVLIC